MAKAKQPWKVQAMYGASLCKEVLCFCTCTLCVTRRWRNKPGTLCDIRTAAVLMYSGCVTRRKLQTPGNAEEHKRQETPTINTIGPTDKPHRPSTKHYRKDSLGDA